MKQQQRKRKDRLLVRRSSKRAVTAKEIEKRDFKGQDGPTAFLASHHPSLSFVGVKRNGLKMEVVLLGEGLWDKKSLFYFSNPPWGDNTLF